MNKRHYKCQNCGHVFIDDTWQAWACPKCSSNDIIWVEEANDG